MENLNHFDCRSPPLPQQELLVVTSCVPNPALDAASEKALLSQRIAALLQS
jgi:hypothetical protein